MAGWMAPLYSANAGEAITVAQLMREEEHEAAEAEAAQIARIAEAEHRLEQRLSKRKGGA